MSVKSNSRIQINLIDFSAALRKKEMRVDAMLLQRRKPHIAPLYVDVRDFRMILVAAVTG